MRSARTRSRRVDLAILGGADARWRALLLSLEAYVTDTRVPMASLISLRHSFVP